jgi:anti-anti-sigma regulatory factor
MVIASGLFDRWTLGQVKEATRRDATHVTDNYLALGQMAFVVAVGMFVNLVAAVGAGVALSVIVFVAEMSRSPIRRVRSGSSVRSARQRPENLTELLRSEGHRIAVIELEGTIFFGSCDSLATRAEDLADEGAEFVLLDLKRVRAVDATGYKVLGQTFQRLRSRGATLAFSYVTSGGLKPEIAEDLLLNGVPEARLFESTDAALEYFEEGLLMKIGAGESRPGGWALADFGESWGMDEEECAILDGFLEPRHFEAGDFVFREGDTSRSMYLLARGSADVSIPIPGEGRRRRLATFAQGTIFGEMALLDGLPRAAGVQASGPLELFELSHESFVELSANHADIAVKLQGTIGRILGVRLRGANELILESDS